MTSRELARDLARARPRSRVSSQVQLRLALVQHTVLELVPIPLGPPLPPPPPPEPPAGFAAVPPPPEAPSPDYATSLLAQALGGPPPPDKPAAASAAAQRTGGGPICFWQANVMSLATQADLLRSLHALCRAYVAAALSLPTTPSLDAARTTTVAGFVCLLDAVLLARVERSPSLFCEHYAGRAGGPTAGFGVTLGAYAAESDACQLLSPALALARPQLLAYANARAAALRPDHLIFQFHTSLKLSPADDQASPPPSLRFVLPSPPTLQLTLPRPPMAFPGLPWPSVAFHGLPRPSTAFHGLPWPSTAFH